MRENLYGVLVFASLLTFVLAVVAAVIFMGSSCKIERQMINTDALSKKEVETLEAQIASDPNLKIDGFLSRENFIALKKYCEAENMRLP